MNLIFPMCLIFVVSCAQAYSQISIAQLGTPYTQNFNTLTSSGSGTWTNNSTLAGWYHYRTGTGNTYTAGNGSNNSGGLYSFGSTSASDRALGGVSSGNAAVLDLYWGVRLVNNTGQTVNSISVSYYGEQWRVSGANASQTASFSYQIGPSITSLNSGTWTPYNVLDFTSPVPNGSASALDGNASANRVLLTQSIGVTIQNGQEIMLRWEDIDHPSADHGLAIDDFSVSFSLTFLPVELVNFRAVLRNEKVDLRWKTITEKNNHGFEVQRSVGDAAWSRVGFVTGNGTVNTPREYFFVDIPPKGVMLRYRLKQIDRDGTTELGPELSVSQRDIASAVQMTLSPNPLSHEGQLAVALSEPQDVELLVCDALGARLMTVHAGTLDAGIHFFTLRLADLVPGKYFLVSVSDGRPHLIRFVKI